MIAEGTAGAEKTIQEIRERLNAIMDSIKTGILVIDAETHRIADANPAALEMIGVSRDRLLGSGCHDYISPAEKGKYPITDFDRIKRDRKGSGEGIGVNQPAADLQP